MIIINVLMEELLKNANEFLDSGEDNLTKKRFNAAISDFFKAIVILCDYRIYIQIKILPKNHNERFSLLMKYFPEVYTNASKLFKTYVKTYNLRLGLKDVAEARKYAYELKNSINK